MNPDWRAGVFSSPVIMAAMNPHLALREVGCIAGTCRWPAAWREVMTTVLKMRDRIAQRWPRGIYITREDAGDLIAAVQQKARQALLPVRAYHFACWVGDCSGSRKVPCTQLVSLETMPYSSCHHCVLKMTPRHLISTHKPYHYITARLRRVLQSFAALGIPHKHAVIRFVGAYMKDHVDMKLFTPKTKQHLCTDLDAYIAQLMLKHDVHAAFLNKLKFSDF
jgi:hypothetical protein